MWLTVRHWTGTQAERARQSAGARRRVAGLAIKTKVPKAPTWGLLVGVGVLDLLFGPFVLAGIERASITPGISPGFSLDYIDWSHSLAMSLVWSVLYGVLFARLEPVVATAMGVSVFSHFVLDLVVHPADMALWPGSQVHLGFGLWRVLPTGWWFVELAVIGAGVAYYYWKSRTDRSFGYRAGVVASVVMVLHVLNSPWLKAR